MFYTHNTNKNWRPPLRLTRLIFCEFLQRVANSTGLQPRRNGKGYIARCPAHKDKKPSLSICEGDDGKILMRCHAGCTFNEICSALGITAQDLFPRNRRTNR